MRAFPPHGTREITEGEGKGKRNESLHNHRQRCVTAEISCHEGSNVVSWSGLYSAQNCIYLPDRTSFNWKSRDGVVRVNCQKQARDAIESGTDLRMMPNGAGDPTRPYSLLLGNQRELDAVIETRRGIEGNKARTYGNSTAGKQEEARAEMP